MPRISLWASLLLVSGQVWAATPVEDQLRAKVSASRAPDNPNTDWRAMAATLSAQPAPRASGCADVNKKSLAGTYVLTTDGSGRPCHLYDLSFPTLDTMTGSLKVGRLPTQDFTARDYLDGLSGNYTPVLRRVNEFNAGKVAPTARWTRGLRFKPSFAARALVPGTQLPTSFLASDLDVGAFQWEARDRELLARLSDQAGAWGPILDQPETLLAHIRFDWNDLEKVYDIALEGQFLPLAGPMVLVDYDRPYRMAVETLLRSVVRSALANVLRFVPPPARAVLAIAIEDSFDFLDAAYAYQTNALEETLRHQELSDERALNILAGGRADFVTEYMKSVIAKRPFDWSVFEDLGRTLRYNSERRRDIKMSELNSRMTLNDGCTMSLVYDYFGVCAKAGHQRMHSMISELSIPFFKLGAPLAHDFENPAAVTLRRATAYMLSVGARLVTLPYLGSLTARLAKMCKQYAFAGVEDEGFLRGAIRMQPQPTARELEISRWLYLQNLDVFLPKSGAAEAAIIKTNAAKLGVNF